MQEGARERRKARDAAGESGRAQDGADGARRCGKVHEGARRRRREREGVGGREKAGCKRLLDAAGHCRRAKAARTPHLANTYGVKGVASHTTFKFQQRTEY